MTWRQHPTKHQLYGHLPSITKTIKVRLTRHAGHCWRNGDELLRIPTYGRAKAGRQARTYIQQLCEDTGCCPKDLPEVMNDREKWRERVKDIRVSGKTWWWWWKWIKNRILLSFIAGPKIQACRHFLTSQIRIIIYLFWSLNIFLLISFWAEFSTIFLFCIFRWLVDKYKM